MSIKTIIALLVFLALGVFLYMNKEKVMSYFKGGMGQEQMQSMPVVEEVDEEMVVEEAPDMEG